LNDLRRFEILTLKYKVLRNTFVTKRDSWGWGDALGCAAQDTPALHHPKAGQNRPSTNAQFAESQVAFTG
jgi:hypothetical protein